MALYGSFGFLGLVAAYTLGICAPLESLVDGLSSPALALLGLAVTVNCCIFLAGLRTGAPSAPRLRSRGPGHCVVRRLGRHRHGPRRAGRAGADVDAVDGIWRRRSLRRPAPRPGVAATGWVRNARTGRGQGLPRRPVDPGLVWRGSGRSSPSVCCSSPLPTATSASGRLAGLRCDSRSVVTRLGCLVRVMARRVSEAIPHLDCERAATPQRAYRVPQG